MNTSPYGYYDYKTNQHYWYVTNRQGSTMAVIDWGGKHIYQRRGYYPSGTPFVLPCDVPSDETGKETERLHIGNRWISHSGINYYDNDARLHDPVLCRFASTDPLAEKFGSYGVYSHCNANPVNIFDPTGKAWRYNDGDYEWVPREESYDEGGNLLEGLYEQAIVFSETGSKGKFNPYKKSNIGTSTAYVYLANGSMWKYDACTYPSDLEKYATVPAGNYEAKVGMHKGSYEALRLSDVGTTNFYANSIELGAPNPAHPEITKAYGINIHLPGTNNITGLIQNDVPISMGCLLIDSKQWKKFISHFNNPEQKNNIIGVTIKR